MNMDKRKVVIVDDERPALDVLATLVKTRPELEIVLGTTQFQEAWDYLDEHDIDILLVDLDLRVESGYRLMGAVDEPTQIIVCTASKDQGTEAIGRGAIDFLTKMVAPERFNYAIERALRQLELLENLEKNKSYPSTLMVPLAPDDSSDDEKRRNPEPNHYNSFSVDKLAYIRSEGKNSRLFFNDGTELFAKQLLRELQTGLDPDTFIRTQRGFIVNRRSIVGYKPGTEFGTKHWWILLEEPEPNFWENTLEKGKIPVGEKYRYRVEKILGIRK